MSGRIGEITIICVTKPDKCELCEKIDELRPYGPNGENVCFACANKDPANMKKKLHKFLFNEDV